MKANTPVERLYNGIIKENPTFVLVLGMCPTLAVTTAAINGIGMGLTTTVVLMMSNLFISLLRNVIPDKVRMPAYIVIVASFVTMVQLLLQGFIPVLYDALGIYIPLIVVNCIILGRAEAYASKNGPVSSIFDGIGMGLGFTPASIFILAPGAFFVLAFLAAIRAKMQEKKPEKERHPVHCMEGACASCSNKSCSGKFYDNTEVKK